MPRPKTNKLYRNFVKGLVTEAGFLTYPENASTDELNTVIKIKGSRSRRFGIDYEPSSTGASLAIGADQLDCYASFVWRSVSNAASINFLCVQIEGVLYFFNADATPVDGSIKSFTIDLSTYASPTATISQVDTTPIQMAAGKGYLFVVSPYIEPIIVEYKKATSDITVTPLIILVRDFDGVDDGLGNEDQPTTISALHYYNLRNQGWVQPGPDGVVAGSPTNSTGTGGAPAGSSSGTGGGGTYISPHDGLDHSVLP